MTCYLEPGVAQTAFDGRAGPSYSWFPKADSSKAPRTVDCWLGPDKTEPIAIVGLSLRFPQEATTAANFWKLLLKAKCTVTPFPEDRLSVSGNYHPEPGRRDTVSAFPAVGPFSDTITPWS